MHNEETNISLFILRLKSIKNFMQIPLICKKLMRKLEYKRRI